MEAQQVSKRLPSAVLVSDSATQLNRSSSSSTGGRDLQFVHAFIVYQLLSRRIQRDLLLISTLLHQSQSSSHPTGSKAAAGPSKQAPGRAQVDARLFPAVVKLLDTVIQSLTQMRALSIVDDSPDLATAVDVRVSFSKARRSVGSLPRASTV